MDVRVCRHILEFILPHLDVMSLYVDVVEWLGELCIKVDFLIVRPSSRVAVASYSNSVLYCSAWRWLTSLRVHNLNECIHSSVPASTVHQVDDNTYVVVVWESVAVHADMAGRGQLCNDTEACERYAVVAWFGYFLAAVCI